MKAFKFLVPIFLFLISYTAQGQDSGCIDGSCQNGQGKYVYTNGYIYQGNFKDGVRSGLGTLTTPAGDVYQGMWAKDKFNGQGTYKWADGSKYTGAWKDGVQQGYGIFFYTNGDKYTGYFKNNKFDGKGKYTWADGTKQEGTYKNGKFLHK